MKAILIGFLLGAAMAMTVAGTAQAMPATSDETMISQDGARETGGLLFSAHLDFSLPAPVMLLMSCIAGLGMLRWRLRAAAL